LTGGAIKGNISNNLVISSNPDEALVIWTVIVPFVSYGSELIFRMETENSDGSIRYTTFNTFDLSSIARNTLTPYEVVLKKENVHTDDLVNESLVNSPANSYIISEAGKYVISIKTPTGIEIAGGTEATWLWASKAGGGKQFDIDELIGDIEYDSQEKRIMFRAGTENEVFNKGNVILALRDASNNSNNILWSWHIWLTDKPEDVVYATGTFMDRNLGALTDNGAPAVDAYGFVYQWGRKDPFYGGDGIVPDESTVPFLIANDNTKINNGLSWNKKEFPGNLTDAARNPMQFICDDRSLPNDELEDWMTNSDNNLWGANGSKTENDPCPYGYRVPSKENLIILHDSYTYNHFKQINNTYWEYDLITNRWSAAGRRQGSASSTEGNGGQLKYSGTASNQGQLFYWTRTPMNVSGISWRGASHRLYSNGNELWGDHEFGGRADAYSVRCVKE
jgi:hypothetical protein